MRFLTTFKKTKECSFESWLKLVDDLQPHMQKNGLKLIVATETEDGTRIYDILSKPPATIDSQEVNLRKDEESWIAGKIFILQAS